MLKGRRGKEELLLSYLTVTNPARRAERRHPLNTRLNTKSAIASFKFRHNGPWQTTPQGMGTTELVQHFQSLPGMLTGKAPSPSHLISLVMSEAIQSSLTTIKMSEDSTGAIP